MNYWWVNQNQTFDQEINGGYMWSPKTKRNGARNQYYENMKDALPGDIVFSYSQQQIKRIDILILRLSRWFDAPVVESGQTRVQRWRHDPVAAYRGAQQQVGKLNVCG